MLEGPNAGEPLNGAVRAEGIGKERRSQKIYACLLLRWRYRPSPDGLFDHGSSGQGTRCVVGALRRPGREIKP
ncbi:MAG: hypothetical protein CM1200mP26_13920 [Acidimicrobiales bacterium]|nr:MAG: hypothetical protein CM1200mP26_13920 [Acidimicrobiales bacterium]